MLVRYVNHAGTAFTLYGDNLSFIDPMQLHTWEWSYDLSNRVNGLGGRATGFARRPRPFELELRMRGYTHAQFLQQVNTLHAVADADNMAGQPGKLYVDDQYMRCYLAVSGDQPNHPRLSNFMTRDVTVLAVEPFWCTEKSFDIFPAATEETGTNYGKKYNLRYGYRYGTGLAGYSINNTHYADTPAIITVFGPAVNPSAVIGGNTYAVNVTLLASERLVIDQITNQIYTISGTGVQTSVFNSRDKQHDIFQPIRPGTNAIVYSGDYKMQITLVQQRSELLWTD